jgi:hypothetical protein
MKRGDDGSRLGDGVLDGREHRARRGGDRLRHVLPKRDQPLHGAVVQRLREAGPLALLGAQNLLQEPFAVGGQA